MEIPADSTYQNQRTPKEAQRLFVDMDGTLAVFKPVNQLEELLEKGYFAKRPPIDNVVEAVRLIQKQSPEIEVYILSAYLSDSQYALDEKNEWLNRYLPEFDAEHRIFMPCGQDKSEFVPHGLRETDFLLDDYTKNLRLWEPPARGIKLLNGVNYTHGTWTSDRIRYDHDPQELATSIVNVMQGRVRVLEECHGLRPAPEQSYSAFASKEERPHVVAATVNASSACEKSEPVIASTREAAIAPAAPEPMEF